MASQVNALGTLGFVSAVIAAGLLGASIGTVYWQTPPGTDISIGLFESCEQTPCSKLGWSIDNNYDITLITTRSILGLSCLFLLIGLIIALTAFCGSGDIRSSGAIIIASGVLCFSGCAVYTGMLILLVGYGGDNVTSDYFGPSFYICWGTAPFLILAGIFNCLGRRPIPHSQVHPDEENEMAWTSHMRPQPPTNPYYQG